MKKKIKTALIISACIFTLVLIWALSVNAYVRSNTKAWIITAEQAETLENVDCIIVLGCLVRPDGSPSGMLEDRLTTGVDLWSRGVSDTMLMSGDHGTVEYDEVNAMRDFAVKNGVPIERIFMDHAGFCTYDSIYRLKEVFGAKKVVIVTQQYHLYRALYIANALGLEAYGGSADIHRYYGQTGRNLRELIARNKDFLYCIIKPKPKYLGSPIDLDGDGRVTEG